MFAALASQHTSLMYGLPTSMIANSSPAIIRALNSTLTTLSTLATAQTRRLDYTHYALLSHLSSLLSTLSLLASLRLSTHSHLESFTTSSRSVTANAESQLRHFDAETFAGMKARAEALERRVKEAGRRVRGLEGRLRGVREGVEGEEGAERERERGRLWRWWCGVVVAGVVVAGWVLLVVGRDGARGAVQGRGREGVGFPMEGVGEANEIGVERMKSQGRRAQGRPMADTGTRDEWEPRLRMLEEL